jgi:manganese/iron transport system ATP-binding protein
MYPHTHHELNKPILDVRNIAVRYNGRVALEEITFHLHGGERIAVVGPNGAGKSTLFKVVSGVLQPNAGEVTIFGSRPRGHVCIAYIPQRSQVDWNFPVSVADAVMMGRSAKLGQKRLGVRSTCAGDRRISRSGGASDRPAFRGTAAAYVHRPGACAGSRAHADG